MGCLRSTTSVTFFVTVALLIPCHGFHSTLIIRGLRNKASARSLATLDVFRDPIHHDTSIDGRISRHCAPIQIAKDFIGTVERSGKSYCWIKELPQPISNTLKCILAMPINSLKAISLYFSASLLRRDFVRRASVYRSDWVDGFKNLNKVIPAVLFLYFACLAPVISFGTIASHLTNNSMGVVEFLLSAGGSGIVSENEVYIKTSRNIASNLVVS